MYESRRNPERSVEGILEPAEWQAMYVLVHRTKKIPKVAPRLGECVQWMAKLGGFLACIIHEVWQTVDKQVKTYQKLVKVGIRADKEKKP